MTTDVVDYKRLKMAKYKCKKSLLFQTRYLFKERHKRKFVVGDHHEIICEALEKVLRGEIKRLIINIAPRYGKTELAVKNFIAHGLGINPAAKFIHLTYSATLALDNSEEAKDIVQSAEYQALFPEVQIKADSKAKNKWYTTVGGGVYAAAAGGQVTGFGAGKVDEEEEDDEEALANAINEVMSSIEGKEGFGGAIIIDDPLKPEDGNSDTIRERVNQRFDSTIRNRTNSRNTPIIVIGQRVHPNDLSGYLTETEPGEWTVISLPCLSIGPDGKLKALWPFKHTVEELQKLRAINPIVYDTQFDQNPKPKEGLLFPEDELNYYNPETVDVEKLADFRFGYIDPADEGGDDLSFPICYQVANKIYVPEVVYNNHGTDVNEPACVDLITARKLNAVEIEGNSAWILFAKAVRKLVTETYEDCEIRVIKNSKNKHTRILAEYAFIKRNFVFRSDWKDIPEYRKFMINLTSYLRIQAGASKNNHEDAPDSLTGVARYFKKNHTHIKW